MRVLVLGGEGMLGHKVVQILQTQFDVWATTRSSAEDLLRYPSYAATSVERLLGGVDVLNFDSVCVAFGQARPEVVVNAVGIIKQLREAHDPILSIQINALFPHRLAALCRATRAKLIHVSTDCVFSGTRGMYRESDNGDPEDLYGRTKLVGEVTAPGSLTIRTSIIGRDFEKRTSLLEWFLSQRARVINGFTNVTYSGLSTATLARVMSVLIARHPSLSGLYHVATPPISKYDLLCRLRSALHLDVDIVPTPEPHNDRSLDPAKFLAATGEAIPDWDTIINDLASDPTPYDEWWRNREAPLQVASAKLT